MKETNNLQYIIVMVIKNKDGSVYKLKGPNPLMEDQTFWNDLENFTKDFPYKILSKFFRF